MSESEQQCPSIEQIRNAALSLKPYIVRTPLIRFDPPASWPNGEIDELAFKLELFQVTGSFKARGALLGAGSLSDEQKARGIVAVSRGNHAIAVAYAGRKYGIGTKVIMVEGADPTRVRMCEELGAEVILMPDVAQAFATFEEIQKSEGRASIHPFEGPNPITGTGTIGLELLEDFPDPDVVLVPVGGGGLIGGIASVVKRLRPSCKVLGIEPRRADSMFRSFVAGKAEKAHDTSSIADSLAPPYALPYTFRICHEFVDEIVQVDDHALCEALFLMYRDMKLAVEPAGAACIAAITGPLLGRLSGKKVAAIVCGANIAPDLYCTYLQRGAGLADRK